VTVRVRAAGPADFPTVARLTVDAYEADGQAPGEHGYDVVLADVATRARTGEVLVAVDDNAVDHNAVDGDAIVGAVTFVRSGSDYAQLAREGEAEFRMLAVDPAAQRRGVATALVRACLARAADLGCSHVVICARDIAETAHRLYARLGFARIPERDWSPAPGVRLLALTRSVEQAEGDVEGDVAALLVGQVGVAQRERGDVDRDQRQ
jgi:ribosomal protein S18 acetylase RimI-like enzyme